jgi:hypothetical protein
MQPLLLRQPVLALMLPLKPLLPRSQPLMLLNLRLNWHYQLLLRLIAPYFAPQMQHSQPN